ncbi:hypothetical protein ACOSQ4_006150 [Xanthoceras sorbifolium]
MSKRMVIFGLCMILACTLFVRDADQATPSPPTIGYDPIKGGDKPKCRPGHREFCGEGPPANNWTRGRNPGDECRGGGVPSSTMKKNV